jgi:2-aminoethylphosphonate-pyruvate transaminase
VIPGAEIHSAVILAAGMGTRLRGEVEDCPKGFLRLGQQPIIDESIDRLEAAGMQKIVIVTGYCADHYEQLAARRGGLVSTVHNPRFADSGSMYSLYCARDVIDDDFLLLESDLIYEPRALTGLLNESATDAILLSGPTGAGDEVWVETRDGNLVAMSKDRETLTGVVAGELVGISKISAVLFALMQEIAGRTFETSLHYDYETDCLVAAAARRPICCPVVADLVWSEIDDPDHLQRARELIYPRIVSSG